MPLQDLTPQLRTRLRKVEWITGLFLGVTALLMMGGFYYFIRHTAEARGWFITYVPYYTYMPDATGFRPGTEVKMMGFKVGEVVEVKALDLVQRDSWDYYYTNNFNVFVSFKVKEPYFGYIGADSRVRIGGFPIDLAGGNFLEIPSTTVGIPTEKKGPRGVSLVLWEKYAYSPGSNTLKYGPITNDSTGLAKGYYLSLDQSETLVAQAQRILKNVDEITATVKRDLPRTLQDVQRTLLFAEQTVGNLTNDIVQLLVTSRQAVTTLTNDLGGLLANTRRITSQVADVLPGLTNDLASTLAASRKLLSTVDEVLPSIAGGVNTTLTNLNILLLRDTNITANTSAMVSNLNNLITRHWLLRSAFKSKAAPGKPSASPQPNAPDEESSAPRSRPLGPLRWPGRP